MTLPDHIQQTVKSELERYETKRSAIIPSLFAVQKEYGWVNDETIDALSLLMDLPEAWIREVRDFYTMFNRKPVGKKHVQVCCNVSCAMNGGRELAEHLSKTFAVAEGAVSEDGQVTITRVECLGSCDTAPMMQVNDEYYENLTHESAVETIKGL